MRKIYRETNGTTGTAAAGGTAKPETATLNQILQQAQNAIKAAMKHFTDGMDGLNERLLAKMIDLAKTHRTMADRVEDLTTQLATAQENYRQLDGRVTNLNTQIQQLGVESGVAQATIQRLQDEATKLQEDIRTATQELAQAETQLKQHKAGRTLSDQLISDLQQMLQDQDTLISQYQHNVEQLEAKYEELQRHTKSIGGPVSLTQQNAHTQHFGVNLREHLERARKVDEQKYGRQGKF
jgi:chromosome segregation ATPase